MDSYLTSLRKRLAFLLAKAACEVFPDAQVVAAEGTNAVFYADICFSQTFEPAFLPLIEDRFNKLIKQNPSLATLELVAASARGLLEKGRQKLQVAMLPAHPQVLVEAGMLGDFALLVQEKLLESNPEKFFYELLGAYDGGFADGEPVIRIMGIACEDLDSLKSSKKNWARNPYVSPSELAERGYLSPCDESWVWLPQGEVLRQTLLQIWKKFASENGYRFVSTCGNFPFEQGLEALLKSGETNAFAEAAFSVQAAPDFREEGILTPINGWTDRLVKICQKEQVLETCISSLQFILQIPRILSFEEQIVLCSSLTGEAKDLRRAADAAGVDYRCEVHPDRSASTLEVRIGDRLGRWWTVSSLWIAKGQPIPGHRAVYISCFGKWERLVGLLLEKEGIELLQKLNCKLEAGSTL